MIRRSLLMVFCAALLAGPALAAEPIDRILRDLSRLGYGDVKIERTLLGRTRITASNEEADREIILDRRTGEVLRDLFVPKSSGTDSGGAPVGGTRASDDDDKEDEDNDDHDDNSADRSGSSGGNGDDGGHGGSDDNGGNDDDD